MNRILKLMIFCTGIFNCFLVTGQVNCESISPPATLSNGNTVTSASTGDVQAWLNPRSICGGSAFTTANAVWLGEENAFTYTLFFSIPVNSIQVSFGAAGPLANEVFTFTTNSGNPAITTNNSCFSVITGNTITSGLNASLPDAGGGVFLVSTVNSFTQITISGPGGSGGSVFSFCLNVDPCADNLTLINSTHDVSNVSTPIVGVRHRQAQNVITASNHILVGDNGFQNGVVYHAGNAVVLEPDFEADFGSQFSAYIEGCSHSFIYRPNKVTVQSNLTNAPGYNDEALTVFPNPANDKIYITLRNSKLKKVTLCSIDGKLLYDKIHQGVTGLTLSLANYNKGIYIISVTSQNGQVFSKKVINSKM